MFEVSVGFASLFETHKIVPLVVTLIFVPNMMLSSSGYINDVLCIAFLSLFRINCLRPPLKLLFKVKAEPPI